MLIVISPAKSLDFAPVEEAATQPAFLADAVRLAKTSRNLTLTQLKSLMGLSDDLARLNRERFRAFAAEPAPEQVKPAALAFNGDTYQGLEARTLSAADMAYAQEHLRILSGLYGLLRPLDAIQPYRMEMGARLKTRRGKTLYAYWGDQLSKELTRLAEARGTGLLLNCASKEYFGAVDRPSLGLDVITPTFLEERDGKRQMVSFFAKRARGALARFAIETRAAAEADLHAFDAGGYVYDPEASAPAAPVFVRPYPDPV